MSENFSTVQYIRNLLDGKWKYAIVNIESYLNSVTEASMVMNFNINNISNIKRYISGHSIDNCFYLDISRNGELRKVFYQWYPESTDVKGNLLDQLKKLPSSYFTDYNIERLNGSLQHVFSEEEMRELIKTIKLKHKEAERVETIKELSVYKRFVRRLTSKLERIEKTINEYKSNG